jgi:3-hydroxyisobutyrate dehydrogenase-like beta-hydroxyacid dehydrogenase
MNFGIIGTGAMGLPMARNMLNAGNNLYVYARRPERITELRELGALLLDNPADIGRKCDIIILSLPFDPDVEEIMLGTKGVLSEATPGTIIVDTTTGTPAAAIKMAELCDKKEVAYIDAPISGGVQRAEEGKLTFIVGGNSAYINQVRGLLEILGTNIFIVGQVGAGRVLKALNQIIAGMNTLILCETVAMGQGFGIAPKTFYEVLSTCAANSYHLQTKLPNFIIPEKFEGGHRIVMMIKDLEIALGMAKSKNIPLMLTSMGNEMYRAGAGAGYADKDISSMVNYFKSFIKTEI